MSTRPDRPDAVPRHRSLPGGEPDAFARFQARQHRNRQMRQEAIGALAALLQPAAPSTPVHGTPLCVAVHAVGEALGVPMGPPTSPDHTSQGGESLEALAQAWHLRLRRVLLTGNWWQHDSGPLLAYTRAEHQPVALLPVSPGRYVLFDPVRRTRTPVHARLAATLAPEAYTFYRPFPRRALRGLDLLRFGLRGCGKDLRLALLMGMAATLLGMLTPQATAVLIGQAIPDADRGLVLQLGIGLGAAACGQALFQLAQGCALMRQRFASAAAVQAAMWDQVLKLKPSFFRQYTSGDLQARVTTISTMQQQLSGSALRTLLASGMALLHLVLMLSYSVPLALVAGAAVLLAGLATLWTGRRTVRQVRPLHRLTGEIAGTVAQLVHGVAKLRVAGAEERAFAFWGKAYCRQQALRLRIQRLEDRMTVVNAVWPTLASLGLFWCAMLTLQPAETAGSRGLTAGAFLAFHAAFGICMAGATSLSNTVVDLLKVATLWERARPILAATPEVHTTQARPGRLRGALALDHVTFRYQEHGPVVLHDVSLQAAPGEFIALVGPSGSGKSTIVRLLLGFDTPEAGAVYYDDQDLSRLDVAAVRRQLGTVLQHSQLMAGTIFENIAGGGLLPLAEAWEAARAAALAEDIAAMPMGMHTLVSEGGSNLSGGQRQRLLIARALARRPALVLFDEATSALDNRTQAIVTASLARLRVTRVVIAHRLSTIRHADRIYVLEQGRVVQQGRFAELARQDGLFARLIAHQECRQV
jgi:NHLM bacteriocin system ABC transporter ATP-binding protein